MMKKIDESTTINNSKISMEIIKNNFVYSNSKKIIGYWKDGRPIYRILLEGTDFINDLNDYVISNLDLLINYFGIVWFAGTYQFPIGKSIPPSVDNVSGAISEATRIIINPNRSLQVLTEAPRLMHYSYWVVIDYVEKA